ncbi:MAG TPA: ubiquinone/menaquinone biosynthesis methyltransferase [Candidatus Krumholzibacteria bacterium]|nr:ubiquinone/menaquinone biosynthesis methyltransferase [Candidatus Krumholzibacteria bacterium]HPD70416.1 ubiquinone/menaquinone biosynthesis methyltransferase [Candidatus Krumholzibacteria bacterium]HRY39884.1 ubiquinone/menaquinone biosynthesis methyltransferase [Candidatus Krumholzibacteria bacterium]
MGTTTDPHQRDSVTGRVADPAAHARAVRSLFARISGVYDHMNHLLSLDRDRRWRRRVAARLAPETGTVLDLCAGTGDLGLACLAAGRARRVIAVDFVPEMLAGIAAKPGAHDVRPVVGDGLRLPLRADCVDAVVAGFGVRNLTDPAAGLREMLRVLRPGGRILVLDFFRADLAAVGVRRGPPAPVNWALSTLIPAIGRLVARDHAAYAYLSGSMARFLSVGEFADLMRQAGCRDVFVERLTLGIAHVVGGRRG